MSPGVRPEAPKDTIQDLDDSVLELLAKELFIDVPDVTTDIVTLGLIDSLGFTRLFELLEERFGVAIELSDMDLENFRTPDRIASFVRSRTHASEA